MNGDSMKLIKILVVFCACAACFIAVNDTPARDAGSLKVALLFDVGGRGDGGFNDSAYRGLERAVASLGVTAVYIEHKRNLDLERAVKESAASDAGMVIGVGYAFSEKLHSLAQQCPDKKFVCVDYGVKYDDRGRMAPLPANLAGLIFREEEGSYLVGAMAALKSAAGKIGFIGGMDIPVIRRFQAGYLAGAHALRPDVELLSQFAGITNRAFNDPQKGYEIATSMYRQGADIIYHASGGTGEGLFKAAKEMNRLAIGVDTDQSAQAPGYVLTSMVKYVDVAVFESVKSFVEGKFSGGLKSFGLKEGGVGFVYNRNNRELIPEDMLDIVLALQKNIIAGTLVVPAVNNQTRMFSREELQDLLSQLQIEIMEALEKLDGDLLHSAWRLAGKDLKSALARDVLNKLYRGNPYIIDCETVNDQGIMVAVEPQAHKSSEGADISGQAHMIRLFKTHTPVMSGSFQSVEGPRAVVIHHPIFSQSHQFRGSVATLFAPEYLLSGIIGPVASNLPVDIFLMQTDGLVIYDVDTKQIGLNVITDPLYQPFPELVALVRRMALTDEGEGEYRFYLKVGEPPVEKAVYWRSVALHGAAWRLAIACAKVHIVGH